MLKKIEEKSTMQICHRPYIDHIYPYMTMTIYNHDHILVIYNSELSHCNGISYFRHTRESGR